MAKIIINIILNVTMYETIVIMYLICIKYIQSTKYVRFDALDAYVAVAL